MYTINNVEITQRAGSHCRKCGFEIKKGTKRLVVVYKYHGRTGFAFMDKKCGLAELRGEVKAFSRFIKQLQKK